MSGKKGGKLLALINYRLKVTLNDSRYMIGQMLAYDKHMNLVLGDCEEFRLIKRKKTKGAEEEEDTHQEMKRTLGLVILRGEIIVSISVEGPPPASTEDKTSLAAGIGKAAPAGRGMGINLPGAMRGAPTQFRPPPVSGAPPGFMPPPPGMAPPPGMPGFMPPPPGMFAPPPGFAPPR